ncbi:hypothetical protein BASA81_006695 [Batrachochytrium salamandrivorans]|nr:hypothetical protein BASA81_006695 [Batrachochytrium salamandrivorans]
MSDPVDTKPQIEEDCKKAHCMQYVKSYDACVERVQSGHVHHENANCTGQYFELFHCIDHCAAPKIFKNLKD